MSVGSPAWEPIPRMDEILSDTGITRPPTASGQVSKFPVGLRIGGQGGGFFEGDILHQILQRTSQVPPPTLGKSQTPNQIKLPEFITIMGRRVALPPQLRGLPVQVSPVIPRPPVISSPTPNTGVGLPNFINQRTPNMALDLGSLLGTAVQEYGAYQQAKLQQPAFNPLSSLADVFGSEAPVMAGAACAVPRGFRYNTKGELVKIGRRRRRRLATPSDIKDLAALSAVTTPAEKKTWIATHPS